MRKILSPLLCAAALTLGGVSASAQPPAAPPVSETTISDSREATNSQKDWHFIGHVEMERGTSKIYADDVRYTEDGNHATGTGNVVVAQGNNRLSAERAEWNTETGLGTFYNAWGIATVQPPKTQPRPGGVAPPPVIDQETYVYFFGEKIEKVGPKKYKITNGGFSTCVQPTPRWELHADTVTLNVDHYTLLKNAVFSVKGVPLLYTPYLFYPTKKEDRATGFLIPTYGVSTLRGQSIHNAFFWAMNRSQDTMVYYDWFSKTGQGVGSEYRYNLGGGSDGNIKAYLLDEHETTYAQSSGTSFAVPASRSYDIRGGANQLFPGNIRARGRVDYFSSLTAMQTSNSNVFDASRNQRTYGANLIGAWGTYTFNGTFDHSEYFYTRDSSVLSGSWPRLTFARNERPIAGSDVYFSAGADVARLLRVSSVERSGVIIVSDTGLSRIDVAPQIRYPFKKWQWFTVNSTVSWRDTYYTRSYAPTGNPKITPSVVADLPLNRPLYNLQTQIIGPVFNRVWDTPENGYAEKFKHTIEPFVNIQRTSAVDNFDRIIVFDGIDTFVGGTIYNYGLNNRFFAKRKLTPGSLAVAREFISVELTQSYYTDQRSALYDQRYQTSLVSTSANTSHFSPIALSVRALPSSDVTATVRAEFDSRYLELRTISALATYSWTSRLQTSANWSKKAFIKQLSGFNDPKYLDHYINTSTTIHTKDNRVGGIYGFNYDVLNSRVLNQQISGFYNAQCCGLAFEYQSYNFGGLAGFTAVPADHRFFLSFTLAGLGNFSPFNGALSGVPR